MVQGSLQAGGAEKAMVSLLNTLPEEKYDVDLMLSARTGLFYDQLPKWIKIIDQPFPFNCLSHKPKDWQFYIHHPVMWIKKVRRTWVAKHQKDIHVLQSLWKQWREDIPMFEKEYDVAYGGQEGLCNYYVIDKVHAKRKIIWIHCDYNKLNYSPTFDKEYFYKASIVATMSEKAKQILWQHFPESANHIWYIQNITNGKMIWKMSQENIDDPSYKHIEDGINILSVGRLAPQKKYDRALQAAATLKKRGIKFHWTIIGEGPERNMLEPLRKSLGIEDYVDLLGLRPNPYQYMAHSDMLVVTSQFEGRSIAIDEAQILGLPVITTNYDTAKDAVINGETGIICEMSPESIADSIIRLYEDNNLRNHIQGQLISKKDGNVSEIEKYSRAFGL